MKILSFNILNHLIMKCKTKASGEEYLIVLYDLVSKK
jgi:hypothetical protein